MLFLVFETKLGVGRGQLRRGGDRRELAQAIPGVQHVLRAAVRHEDVRMSVALEDVHGTKTSNRYIAHIIILYIFLFKQNCEGLPVGVPTWGVASHVAYRAVARDGHVTPYLPGAAACAHRGARLVGQRIQRTL